MKILLIVIFLLVAGLVWVIRYCRSYYPNKRKHIDSGNFRTFDEKE